MNKELDLEKVGYLMVGVGFVHDLICAAVCLVLTIGIIAKVGPSML